MPFKFIRRNRSANQANHSAQAQASTRGVNYNNAINNLALEPSRHSRDDIINRVNSLQYYTLQSDRDSRVFETNIFGNNTDTAPTFRFISRYHESENNYEILDSVRNGCPDFNASDAYLAQLSKVMPSDGHNFPAALPSTITRSLITNEATKAVIDNIYNDYPDASEDFFGPNKITLSPSQDDPSSLDAKHLYNLLKNTPNGKSTVHTISDFNEVKGTRYTIESAEISKRPHELTFTLSTLR